MLVALQCGGRLSKQLEGPAYDAFAKTLRGLANSKITKPGQFRTEDGSGYAVRCSLKVMLNAPFYTNSCAVTNQL